MSLAVLEHPHVALKQLLDITVADCWYDVADQRILLFSLGKEWDCSPKARHEFFGRKRKSTNVGMQKARSFKRTLRQFGIWERFNFKVVPMNTF